MSAEQQAIMPYYVIVFAPTLPRAGKGKLARLREELRLRLNALARQGYRIVGITDGLIVLEHAQFSAEHKLLEMAIAVEHEAASLAVPGR